MADAPWALLGTVGVGLALSHALDKRRGEAGSRASTGKTVERDLGRPRIVFEDLPADQRKLIEDAAEKFTETRSGAFGAFMSSGMMRSMALRSAAPSREEIRENLFFQSMVGFVASGRNTVVVGPEMQQQLVRTGLEHVERWMIKEPYESWYIALPDCEWRIHGLEQRMLPVRGVLVDSGFRSNTLSLVIWAPTNDAARTLSRMVSDEQYAWLRGRPDRMKLATEGVKWVGNDLYVNIDLDKAFSTPGGLEAWLAKSWTEALASPEFEGFTAAAAEETAKTRVDIVRVVLGVVMYLQAEGADLSMDRLVEAALERQREAAAKLARVKSASKKKKLQRASAPISSGTVTWIGRGIEEDVLNGRGGERGAMRRHWVRGHWKGVSTKTGSKVRWIQPYQRGSGPGKVTSRTYLIDEEGG